MSQVIEGKQDTLKGFQCLEMCTWTRRTANDWLSYLEECKAFLDDEVKTIVQTLNIESLYSFNDSIYALNGEMFEGKKVYPFSTAKEAVGRNLLLSNAAIICLLYEWVINDEELLFAFDRFVVVSEEFEDNEDKLFYLSIETKEGDPVINKYYLDVLPPVYAGSREAYIFMGPRGLSS